MGQEQECTWEGTALSDGFSGQACGQSESQLVISDVKVGAAASEASCLCGLADFRMQQPSAFGPGL